MTSVSLMEWNPKPNLQWDWENLIMYNDNTNNNNGNNNNPRKLDEEDDEEEEADWEIAEEKGTPVVIHSASFFNGSFSSKSASTTSSQTQTQTQTPPEAKTTAYSSEPLLGLKLGKRTYFEDSASASASVPVNAAAAASTMVMKRSRSSSSGVSVYCQVEGCNLDLSGAKDYHRKHRVCEGHSKCPKVVVAGLERRFCQQCSSLFEFDEKKRSCRKRLSDHNARRRKPQGESLRFNPSRLHSSIYALIPADERQRMSYGWDTRSPLMHGRAGNYLFWDDTSGSKFTITKECPSDSPIHHHHHLVGNQPTMAASVAAAAAAHHRAEASTQGVEVESTVSMQPGDEATQDLQRALSLLSTNSSSWGSCEPPSTITSLETVHATSNGFHPHTLSGMPLQSVDAQMRSFAPSQAANPQHHHRQVQKEPPPPYSAEFYHSQM
ncbi:Squamosa promoter-binding-like protein 2 [Linum grandiflorum]